MLVLRFDVESAFALGRKPPSEKNWRKWIDESLAAVSEICKILRRQRAPATFFVVGLLLEKAGDDFVRLFKQDPSFDIQSHSYSHFRIWHPTQEVSMSEFRRELTRTSELIADHIGQAPVGFCAPGNFYRGLCGKKEQLYVLWEEGYRFIGTDGQGPASHPFPAPFTQPYWYQQDGFPDLLELPLTGWHCNMLFNTGHQNDNYQPAVGFPNGTVLERLPASLEDGFEVRKKEFRYAIDHQLIYSPCMHPWSIYRFDPELKHLEWLIEMAKCEGVSIVNCVQLYEKYKADVVPPPLKKED